MKKIIMLFGICLFAVNLLCAQTLPAGFSLTTIGGSTWVSPVGAAFSKNGQQLFIWEKRGRVYVCNRDGSGNYIKQTTPVLNIGEEVGDWRDHGMLGFALDPNFANNGLIYVMYVVDRHHLLFFGTANYNPVTNTYNSATIGRITRYQTTVSSGNLIANTASRTVLLGETKETGIPILYESHGVGALAFADDGTLLASTGDGASYTGVDGGNRAETYYIQAISDGIIRPEENVGSFRSLQLNSHNGKLLRIDPQNGNGVGSNPFFDATAPRSAKSRVWALGFRNPFRFSVRTGTGSTNPSAGDIGEIYVGDVGWTLWEELNIIKAPGMNCGWPLYEGHGTMAGYFSLNRINPDEPNPLFGTGGCTQQYFTFNDMLKQATADGITTVYNSCNPAIPIGSGNRFFHRRPAVDWRHEQNVARVGIFNGNNAAVDTIGNPGSTVLGTSFSGFASVGGVWYTGNSFPAGYKNTFMQADYVNGWIRRFTINYTDVLTKVDNFGTGFSNIVYLTENPLDGTMVTVQMSSSGVKRISFGGNLPPTAKITSDKIFGPSALNVSFDGTGSSDPNGTIASYAWDFGDPASGVNNTSNLPNPSHTFNASAGVPTKFVVKLTVTDNGGATGTDSIVISVNNTPPVVDITSPLNSFYIVGPDTLYSLSSSVTDAEHADPQLSYAWQTVLKHNAHEHAEPLDTNRLSSTLISRIGCNGELYSWLIRLTVTDAAGLSGTDSVTLTPSCPGALPLVLKNFSVTQQGGSNLIRWATELAMQIEDFEVERSIDGFNFFPINRQVARNSTTVEHYSFNDMNVPSGVLFYRLKINEVGNIGKYSVIVRVETSVKKEQLLVAPNPVVGNFSIRYHSADDGVALIRITDAGGKLVHSIRESVNKGVNIVYIQNLPAWKTGLYLISVQQGNEIQYGKLIKAE